MSRLLTVILLALCSQATFAGTQIVTVVDSQGEVFFQKPAMGWWQPIRKGVILHFGDLIQVRDGSSIRLTSRGWYDGNRGESRYLNVNLPTTFRLAHDNLREAQFHRFQLEDVPVWEAEAKSRSFDFSLSFERFVSFLGFSAASQKKPTGLDELVGRTGVTSATAQRRIRLLMPYVLDILTVPATPVRYEVRWHDPYSSDGYYIFFWDHRRERGKPIAFTRQRSFKVPVHRFGSFYVQVESRDGTAASQAHFLQISAGDEDERLQTPALTVLSPERNTTFFTNTRGSDVLFYWVADGVVVDELFYRAKKGSWQGAKLSPWQSFFRLTLAPDDYEYFFKVDAKKTEVRSFRVIDSNSYSKVSGLGPKEGEVIKVTDLSQALSIDL